MFKKRSQKLSLTFFSLKTSAVDEALAFSARLFFNLCSWPLGAPAGSEGSQTKSDQNYAPAHQRINVFQTANWT